MTTIGIFVAGTPAPQGSKRFVGVHGGKGIMIESAGDKVKSWRADVREAFAYALDAPLTGPIHVEVRFYLRRPASVSQRRRPLPTVKPDLDKLARSTLDALKSAGVYGDDSQVVAFTVSKFYADTDQPTPGAWVAITEGEKS